MAIGKALNKCPSSHVDMDDGVIKEVCGIARTMQATPTTKLTLEMT